MTETREQWIEREAREARARYWGSIGDWYSVQEHIRQDWRNVVAPYYPAPLRVPVDVEGLAKAMYEAPGADGTVWKWDEASEFSRRGLLAEARAVLAFLNIEPCEKPEYDPVDVAFRDALKRSQEIVNNWTPEQRNHNSIGYAGLQDNERNELENLRVECKRLRHKVEVERDRANDLLADKNWAEAECERLCVKASYATAKAERQRKALDTNRKTIENKNAQIATLEERIREVALGWMKANGVIGSEKPAVSATVNVGMTPNECNELINLRAECERLRTQQPETEALREVFSREECRHFVAEGEPFTVGVRRLATAYQHVLPKLAVLKDRAEKAEADRDRFHEESNRLSNECSDLEDQLADRTQQPETRAVKVRFDVTAEELFWEMDDDNLPYPIENVEGIALVQHAMDRLSAHAVLEVPPGVPSVEKLVKMYEQSSGYPPENKRFPLRAAGVAAVRDAILSAMPQRREWTGLDVEELAEAICNAASNHNNIAITGSWSGTSYSDHYRAGARAALAWFDGKRGEV